MQAADIRVAVNCTSDRRRTASFVKEELLLTINHYTYSDCS